MKPFTRSEIFFSLSFSLLVFLLLGTLTALWSNPFFVRMSTTTVIDFIILTAESLLLGFYLGIKTTKACSNKKAGFGGIMGFLGFACPICNKLLLILFGSSLLLTYFEPIRIYVGLIGIGILGLALYQKLLTRKIVFETTT